MNIQPPISPFDYGSLVQWTARDGSLMTGEIVGFNVGADGNQSATVEFPDGSDRTVPLSVLSLLPS
jgi:hypothetical protein